MKFSPYQMDPLNPYGQAQPQYDNQYRMKPQVGAHSHDSQGQVMMGPLGVQQPPPGTVGDTLGIVGDALGGQRPSPFTPTNPFSSFPRDPGYQLNPMVGTPQQLNPPIKPGGSITQTPPINTPTPSTGGKG